MEQERNGPVAQYHDEEAWLEERKKFLTASDAAAALGMSPFKTPAQLQREKLGFASGPEENDAMFRGKFFEDKAAELYTMRTGRAVRRAPFKARGVIGASMDRQILAGPTNATGPLELKVPGYFVFREVRKNGLPDSWILQGQLEAWVWRYDYSAFGIMHADSVKMLDFDVAANEDLMGEVGPRLESWWQRHIIDRDPVPEEAAPALAIPDELKNAEIVTLEDPEFLATLEELWGARELRDQTEALYDELAGQLKAKLGVGVFEGGDYRLNIVPKKGRVSTDAKAIEKVRPLDPIKVAMELSSRFGAMPGDLGWLEECRLDFEPFKKTGNPSVSLTPYRLRPGGEG